MCAFLESRFTLHPAPKFSHWVLYVRFSNMHVLTYLWTRLCVCPTSMVDTEKHSWCAAEVLECLLSNNESQFRIVSWSLYQEANFLMLSALGVGPSIRHSWEFSENHSLKRKKINRLCVDKLKTRLIHIDTDHRQRKALYTS